jgi:abortive infection bacteriophage resistance protein
MSEFKKPALEIEQQIDLLKVKGLIINDIGTAKYWLSFVSYFRLRNYTHTFKDYDNMPLGNFHPNTTFENIIDLYLFDRDLKLIIFDAIETIEVALRTLISNRMSCRFGSHWYLNPDHFSHPFDFDNFITKVAESHEDPDEPFILAYKTYFDTPPLAPSWMIMETLSFNKIALIFQYLIPREQKLAICDDLQMPESVLSTWMRCFGFIRNRCAHHSRIVYTAIKFAPRFPSRKKHIFLNDIEEIDVNTLYSALCCMQFLIRIINPRSKFKNNLLKLVDESPFINLQRIGFTTNWREEPIWQ